MDDYLRTSLDGAELPTKVFVANDIPWLLEYPMTPEQIEKVRSLVRGQFGCGVCARRTPQSINLVEPDGPICLAHMDDRGNRIPTFRQLREIAETICSGTPVPKIIDKNSFWSIAKGQNREGENYYHWTFNPEKYYQFGGRKAPVFRALLDYTLGGPLLAGFVAEILHSPAMIESFRLLEVCIRRSHSGTARMVGR